jgi:hypothetical protein
MMSGCDPEDCRIRSKLPGSDADVLKNKWADPSPGAATAETAVVDRTKWICLIAGGPGSIDQSVPSSHQPSC